MVAEELGLEEGSLTGTWDFSHNLQIVWNNSLANHPTVEELVSLMFSTMDDFRTGQASTVFRERAADLGHLVLNNKKRQTTRFVRSLVRGLQAWFRNLPTLIAIQSSKYEEAATEGRNADAREVLANLSKLRDPRNLLLAIGLAQLLELYTVASLQSQHSYRFPTQAWSVIKEMRAKVAALGERWSWGEEELRFAATEAPAAVKERLVQEGRYRPVVSLSCARKSRVRGETDILKDGQKMKDLFDEDGESVVPLAGEVSMEVPLLWRARRLGRGLYQGQGGEDGRSSGTRFLTEEDVARVEEELQELAGDIVTEWERRQTQTELEKAAFAALAEKFNWGKDSGRVEDEGVKAVVAIGHTRKMEELLRNLVEQLPEAQAERFNDVDSMLEGFSSYLKYKTMKTESMQLGDHEIYKDWYKVRKTGLNFEFIGFRSSVLFPTATSSSQSCSKICRYEHLLRCYITQYLCLT
jgi:hypothetical protein